MLDTAPTDANLAGLVALVLRVAGICNGAGFYLACIGIVDDATYRGYRAFHRGPIEDLRPDQEEPQCIAHSSPEEIPRVPPDVREDAASEERRYGYVYAASGPELSPRRAENVFMFAPVAMSIPGVARRGGEPSTPFATNL